VKKCNDNKKQLSPCPELSTFRALDDRTFIDLPIQSDQTLNVSGPLLAPFRKAKGRRN